MAIFEVLLNTATDAFLKHACLAYTPDDGPARVQMARTMLANDPTIAGADIYTAAASGHVAATRDFLDADPALVGKRGGPMDWEPLLYLAFSRVNCSLPGFDSLEVARLLLGRGADPNAHYLWDGTYRFTALTGAFGEGEQGPENQPPHRHCLELAELLLQAGADPNDGQALYNRMFTPGHECLDLLLRYGLQAHHKINWKTEKSMRTLDFQLLWACRNQREARADVLLVHGADANISDAEGIAVYRHAVRSGDEAMAALLLRHGAREDLLPVDRLLAACLANDRASAERLLAGHPELAAGLAPQDAAGLHLAAGRGNLDAVVLMLDLGFPIDQLEYQGNHATALHHAACNGHLEIVRLLTGRGADVRLRDRSYTATALGWADHFGHSRVIDHLLNCDIDIFDAIWFGTPEQVAGILEREPDAVRALLPDAGEALRPGAAHAPYWLTALHLAASQGRLAAAEILLMRGADPNGSPQQKRSPLALSEAHGHADMAELLRRHGAIGGT